MQMWIYIVRRVALVVPVIIGVMTITFALTTALGPVQQLTSYFGPPPQHSTIRSYNPVIPCSEINSSMTGNCPNPLWQKYAPQLGLDKPIIVQWAIYMYHSLTFQWGHVSAHDSEKQGPLGGLFEDQPAVITLFSWLLPYTIELAILSLVIILLIAIPLGNLAAVYRNRPIDQASRVLSFSGYALPAFLLGTFLVLAIVLALGTSNYIHTPWCPTGETALNEITGSWPSASSAGNCAWPGANPANAYYPNWLQAGVISSPTGFPTIDAIIHGAYWIAFDTVLRMVIPALVIAFGTVAVLLRFVRNSMLEVMNLDFVRTARAKGVPESTVIKRHAGRNSLNVTITVLGLTFAFFLGGFPVIESVFSLNGIGLVLTYSVLPPEDFAIIFGSVLLFTILVVAANLIVDVLYAYLDPRVRLG
ncbi:MAG: ABC transporter permease [Thermoplasmata archaeon]